MTFKLRFGVVPNIGKIFETVRSVNSKTGDVVLSAIDVGADSVGAAKNVFDELFPKFESVQSLAEINQLNISKKADQLDLENTNEQVELNRLALLNKADLTALSWLATLVNTKADQIYVQEQIANLVNGDQAIIQAIQEISVALKENEGLLEALEYTVANRVRFDIATQTLTALQKFNARTNIGAEEVGTASMLISQITTQTIGAATKAQGVKADTALQSADVAPVALSGLFSSLGGQSKIFDVVHSAYTVGANTAISATDTLGVMLGKLQAQISSSQVVWVSASTIASTDGSGRLDISELQFARIDGLLWIRGRLLTIREFDGSTATKNVVLTINDKNYKTKNLSSTLNGNSYDIAVTPIRLTSSNYTKTLYFTVKGNADSDATVLTSSQMILVNPTTVDKLNQTLLGYELQPTCLGGLYY